MPHVTVLVAWAGLSRALRKLQSDCCVSFDRNGALKPCRGSKQIQAQVMKGADVVQLLLSARDMPPGLAKSKG